MNLPILESSIVTNTPWYTNSNNTDHNFSGDWLHIKKDDIAELILYINSLNELDKNNK